MKKQTLIGSTFTWKHPFPLQLQVPSKAPGGWDHYLIHAGEVGTIIGKKRWNDNGYRYFDYVVRWPNGQVSLQSPQEVEAGLEVNSAS